MVNQFLPRQSLKQFKLDVKLLLTRVRIPGDEGRAGLHIKDYSNVYYGASWDFSEDSNFIHFTNYLALFSFSRVILNHTFMLKRREGKTKGSPKCCGFVFMEEKFTKSKRFWKRLVNSSHWKMFIITIIMRFFPVLNVYFVSKKRKLFPVSLERHIFI